MDKELRKILRKTDEIVDKTYELAMMVQDLITEAQELNDQLREYQRKREGNDNRAQTIIGFRPLRNGK